MKLYTFWRSSCSWRVRIALAYKQLDYNSIPIHLQRDGGEQFSVAHQTRNSMRQVPVLEIESADDTVYLSQSMAILEYLEEVYPEHPLLPFNPIQRAYARQIAEGINSGIQPLQNSSTLKRIESLGLSKPEWAKFWIQQGLDRLEEMVQQMPRHSFLVTDHPTIAECCLIPQLYNARRFGCDLSGWTRLLAVESECMKMAAFQESHPDEQADAPTF
jgi:maleylpyruvate isomerase